MAGIRSLLDSTFKRAQLRAAEFQAGLTQLLFRTDDELTVAQTFGVF
jgi:hypothetical protein